MNVSRVYRVEQEDGTGPYHVNNLLDNSVTPAHPTMNPYLLDRCEHGERYLHMRFAFEDMAALAAWFSAEERSILRANAYTVAVLDVQPSHTHTGQGRQVAFNTCAAVEVGRLEIPS